ncbi:MAG: GNAT family N-acetyltransferase [Planctomycetaceae bacterium]
MPGYASREYAGSFSEIAVPRALPHCGGWVLEREIGGGDARDAIGCYPLFQCEKPSRLGDDLARLGDELVTLSIVPDPFADFDINDLKEWFPDVCRPFKQHYVVDFSRNWEESISSHHRRKVRVGSREVQVVRAENPADVLDDWCALYRQLINRHSIRGISRFSRASFEAQLNVPGIVAFQAKQGSETVGSLLWYFHGDVAYYHLGAFSPSGYALGASHVLFHESLAYFAWRRARFAALGSAAGLEANEDDGLARFKQGWANASRTAWFCGRVLNRPAYQQMVAESGSDVGYFPSYRFANDGQRAGTRQIVEPSVPAPHFRSRAVKAELRSSIPIHE